MRSGYKTINLQGSIDIQYDHNGNLISSHTILFLPGLASKGTSKKLFLKAIGKLRKLGYSLNVATYTYLSHRSKIISRFEQDEDEIPEVISKLESIGVKRDRLGLVGACYGAYLSAKYLSHEQGLSFAVMAEPYLGEGSLLLPYRILAKAIKTIPKPFSELVLLPIMNGNQISYQLDLPRLAKFVDQNVTLHDNKVPLLSIMTDSHHFFNRPAIRKNLESSFTTFADISLQQLKSGNPAELTRTLDDFLKKVYKK